MTKTATLLPAAALCTVGVLAIGTATATAADSVVQTTSSSAVVSSGAQLSLVQTSAGNYWHLVAPGGAGEAIWSQDPYNGDPGDALMAYDGLADGLGIHAYLSDGRMASTAGHSSPYYSGWVTGDLPEDHWYTMKVCTEKGGSNISCVSASVQS
ncbi:hypothetical protein [Streptomyces sp. NPDC048411]|uniref:hypothetical protein n=1 Tax=Streptomyces sp. NPDC048411 TaxID=3157206 RepID=UPI00345622C8